MDAGGGAVLGPAKATSLLRGELRSTLTAPPRDG